MFQSEGKTRMTEKSFSHSPIVDREVGVERVCNKTPMRSLDFAEQASLTLPELNNVVYKLQPIVKEGKLRCIQKIIRTIKKLKKTQGDEKKIEKARSKAERLLDEMYTLKALSLEQIAQFALGNTDTYLKISNQKEIPLEIKAMTRVSDFAKVQQYIKVFRTKHKDWENLCDFMLFKQTGRRHKKSVDPHLAEKVKASEALVKTYINKKFGGDEEKIKKAEKISSHILKKKKSHANENTDTQVQQNNKNVEIPKKRKLFASIASLDKPEDVIANKSMLSSTHKTSKEGEHVTEKTYESNDTGSTDNDDGNDGNINKQDEESDSSSDEDSSSEDEINHKDIEQLEINNIGKPKSVTNLKKETSSKDKVNLLSDGGSDASSDEDFVKKNTIAHISQSTLLKNSKVKKSKNGNDLSETDSNDSSNDGTLNKQIKDINSNKKIKNSSKSSFKSTELFSKEKEHIIEKKEKHSNKVNVKKVNMDSGNDSDEEFVIKRNKDMVVRKINWEEFGEKDNYQPLIFHGGNDTVKTANPKSDFFEGGDSSQKDTAKGNKSKVGSDSDVDSEEEAVYARGYGKTMIESAFVPSLGRSNQRQRPTTERKEKLPQENKRNVNSKVTAKVSEKSKKTNERVKKGPSMSKATQKQVSEVTGKVHPSWAASMKRKQEQAMISAFKGKKIKFD